MQMCMHICFKTRLALVLVGSCVLIWVWLYYNADKENASS